MPDDVESQLFGSTEPQTIRGPLHLGPAQQEAALEAASGTRAKGPLADMPMIDKAALLSAPVPVVGDIVGGAADAKAIADDPSPFNITMGALGMLPFVPSGMRAIGSSAEVSDKFKKGVDKALAGGANSSRSREALIEMKGQDFLDVAKPGKADEKLDALRKSLIDNNEDLEDLPTLWLDDTGDTIAVKGHEGRHRIRALREAGEDRVPVRVIRTMKRGEFTPPDEVIGEGKEELFRIGQKNAARQQGAEDRIDEAVRRRRVEKQLFGE